MSLVFIYIISGNNIVELSFTAAFRDAASDCKLLFHSSVFLSYKWYLFSKYTDKALRVTVYQINYLDNFFCQKRRKKIHQMLRIMFYDSTLGADAFPDYS